MQVRLICYLGLNAGVPWLSDTDGRKFFICKNSVEDAGHFFFDCMPFGENFTILWSNLKTTLFNASPLESNFMFSFSVNLDRKHKTVFLFRGFSLPFDSKITTIVKRFVSTAVGKIYKIRSDKLCDLEARGLKSSNFSCFLSFVLVNRYVMLCYVMSCHVMSCHVMSCHVMSCHVMSCHVMSCHVMSCHVMSCHVMSCHVCYVMLCYVMLCYVMCNNKL